MVSLPSILSQKYAESRGFSGYTVGTKYEDGRIHMTNPERPDMGEHIIWSGQACDSCPVDPVDLIKHLSNAKFSFTRLDLAVDAINCNLRPQQATEELRFGRCKTRAKKSPTNSDPRDKGYTQYIGTQASEIFLRIYDKAEEMGTVGDHTRVELVCKHGRANQAARQVVSGTDFRRMVVSFADFEEWSEWRAIMALPAVKLPSERPPSNTERWLLDQCAPALARMIYFASNTDFYERFKDEVMFRLEQLSKNGQTSGN